MSNVLAFIALFVALASPNPFTLGPTPTPAPSAAPNWQLPEIGRVRATTPGCAVMRDLIAPSFAASMRADVRFAKIRKGLPTYVDIVDDPSHRNGPRHEMLLAELDRDAQKLRDEALVLNRALGDPRLVRPTDPQLIAEKRELQQLYDTQSGRANILWEFVTRERVAVMRSGMGGTSQANGYGASGLPTRQPLAEMTSAPLNQPPPLRGIDLSDEHAMDDWANEISVQTLASERHMAQALLPISKSCR